MMISVISKRCFLLQLCFLRSLSATTANEPLTICLGASIKGRRLLAELAHKNSEHDTLSSVLRPVDAFLGLPYAQPPISSLRYTPPRRFTSFNTTSFVDARSFKSVCLQPAFTKSGRLGSEDCLYLNLFRPVGKKDESNAELLPVFFFIHGGGYTVGSGMFYDGRTLAAEENVIVVTVNYRLGVFGFLDLNVQQADHNTPENLTFTSGNLGLLDMHAALIWIQEHVSCFGGNPKEVTIVGQSAGGNAVQLLLEGDFGTHELPFRRAIVQSAYYNVMASQKMRQVTQQFLTNIKCESIACLRTVSSSKIDIGQAPLFDFPGVADLCECMVKANCTNVTEKQANETNCQACKNALDKSSYKNLHLSFDSNGSKFQLRRLSGPGLAQEEQNLLDSKELGKNGDLNQTDKDIFATINHAIASDQSLACEYIVAQMNQDSASSTRFPTGPYVDGQVLKKNPLKANQAEVENALGINTVETNSLDNETVSNSRFSGMRHKLSGIEVLTGYNWDEGSDLLVFDVLQQAFKEEGFSFYNTYNVTRLMYTKDHRYHSSEAGSSTDSLNNVDGVNVLLESERRDFAAVTQHKNRKSCMDFRMEKQENIRTFFLRFVPWFSQYLVQSGLAGPGFLGLDWERFSTLDMFESKNEKRHLKNLIHDSRVAFAMELYELYFEPLFVEQWLVVRKLIKTNILENLDLETYPVNTIKQFEDVLRFNDSRNNFDPLAPDCIIASHNLMVIPWQLAAYHVFMDSTYRCSTMSFNNAFAKQWVLSNAKWNTTVARTITNRIPLWRYEFDAFEGCHGHNDKQMYMNDISVATDHRAIDPDALRALALQQHLFSNPGAFVAHGAELCQIFGDPVLCVMRCGRSNKMSGFPSVDDSRLREVWGDFVHGKASTRRAVEQEQHIHTGTLDFSVAGLVTSKTLQSLSKLTQLSERKLEDFELRTAANNPRWTPQLIEWDSVNLDLKDHRSIENLSSADMFFSQNADVKDSGLRSKVAVFFDKNLRIGTDIYYQAVCRAFWEARIFDADRRHLAQKVDQDRTEDKNEIKVHLKGLEFYPNVLSTSPKFAKKRRKQSFDSNKFGLMNKFYSHLGFNRHSLEHFLGHKYGPSTAALLLPSFLFAFTIVIALLDQLITSGKLRETFVRLGTRITVRLSATFRSQYDSIQLIGIVSTDHRIDTVSEIPSEDRKTNVLTDARNTVAGSVRTTYTDLEEPFLKPSETNL